MHKARLALAIAGFAAHSLIFGIFLLHQIAVQGVALAVILALCLLKLGWRKTLKQFKLIAPFAISLFVVYTILILVGFAPAGQPALSYWLAYGLPRLLLLISSLLAFRWFVSFVDYEGLLKSTSNIHLQKYLILGKILYQAAFQSLPQIRYWQEMIPSAQIPSRGLKHRFNRALASSLALVLIVMEQAESKGELIDNRIQTCHKEE
ncbi:MAG: hypothetical protein LHW44_07450 [Candidatus Cloacimonetes bacterium]|nr:hypothetical protein [Candidatus Cloacimonadota bacterium]